MGNDKDEKGSVVVAVRVRPLPDSDKSRENLAVKMSGTTVTILPPNGFATTSVATGASALAQSYSFDYAYWSVNQCTGAKRLATQETVYADIGRTTLQNSLKGYNCCILAYGQTGSGKSYSMFGDENENRRRKRDTSPSPRVAKMRNSPTTTNKGAGLIPRIIDDLYSYIDSRPDVRITVEVTFYQIYLERVTCLLNTQQGVLKVREHPLTGPYVEDLTCLVIDSKRNLLKLLDAGNKSRVVTHTKQNMVSSRSHAVITLSINQQNTTSNTSTISKLSLIDLAGSERVSKSGSSGLGVMEASAINQSLSTLGKVISVLGSSKKRAANSHVPYRDSVLTWLLKESLGGNSKTTMLATISSSQRDREESLSTLRYADQAKRIVNRAIVNDQVSNKKIAAQLKSEIKNLQQQLHKGADVVLQQKLVQSQKLMQQMSRTWDEKWQLTQKVLHEKEAETTKLQQEKDNMSLEIKRLSSELNKTQQERDSVAEQANARVDRMKSEMNRLQSQYSRMELELKLPQPQPPQQPNSSLGLIKEIRKSAASIRDNFKSSPRPTSSVRNPSPSSRPTRVSSVSCNSERTATTSTSTERDFLSTRSAKERNPIINSDSYTSPAVQNRSQRDRIAAGYASSSMYSSDSDITDTETETDRSESPPAITRSSRNNSLGSVSIPLGGGIGNDISTDSSFLTDRSDRTGHLGINRLSLGTNQIRTQITTPNASTNILDRSERELTPRLKSSFFDGPRPGSPVIPTRVPSPKLQTGEVKRRSEEDERWKKWLEDKKKRAGGHNSIISRNNSFSGNSGARPTSVTTQKSTEGVLKKSRPSTPIPIRKTDDSKSTTSYIRSSSQLGVGESQSLRSASQLASHLNGLNYVDNRTTNSIPIPEEQPTSKKSPRPGAIGDEFFSSSRPVRSPRPQIRATDENSSSGLTDETTNTGNMMYNSAVKKSPRPQSIHHSGHEDGEGSRTATHLILEDYTHNKPVRSPRPTRQIADDSEDVVHKVRHEDPTSNRIMKSPRPQSRYTSDGDYDISEEGVGVSVKSPRPQVRRDDSRNRPIPVVVTSNGASSGGRLRNVNGMKQYNNQNQNRQSGSRHTDVTDTDSSTDTSSCCSDETDHSDGSRLSIKRATEQNTSKAIKESEVVRRRIDDDYRRQKLGLTPLTPPPSNNSSVLSDRKKMCSVSFQEHHSFIDCDHSSKENSPPQKPSRCQLTSQPSSNRSGNGFSSIGGRY